MQKQLIKKSGFTLAEVLITLGVIGVVASMTMPTLITNHREKVLITQNKVAYSLMTQALEKVKIDNEYWLDALFAPSNTNLESIEKFAKYFKNAKVVTNAERYRIKYMKKFEATNGKNAYENMPMQRLLLSNGIILSVSQNTCVPHVYEAISYDSTGAIIYDESGAPVKYTYSEKKCASIIVDVNGEKSPNQFGRDVFRIWIEDQSYKFPSTARWGDIENIIRTGKFSDSIQDYDVYGNFSD